MFAHIPAALQIEGLSFYYPEKYKDTPVSPAVDSVTLPIVAHAITAIIGPSGCGKSTLLRCLNRMNDQINDKSRGKIQYEGKILLPTGENILEEGVDTILLRKRVGMVFQKPNPFPKSIFENVAYGLRIHGIVGSKSECAIAVEKNLTEVGLWQEVKDRLNKPAESLSGGQQQRLCIARAIALEPQIILMDEPCGSLDPTATAIIENLLANLKEKYSIVLVTHSMMQARRLSDYVAYMEGGQVLEYASTVDLFQNPQTRGAKSFVQGLIG